MGSPNSGYLTPWDIYNNYKCTKAKKRTSILKNTDTDSVRNRTVAQRIELGPSGDMPKPTGKVRIPPKRQSAFKEEVFERSSTPSQIVQVPKRAPSLFKQRRTKQ